METDGCSVRAPAVGLLLITLDDSLCVHGVRQSITFDGDNPTAEVRATLRRILLASHVSRCKEDYEFVDKYVHFVNYFSDIPPRERLRYLKAVKGIEIDQGEALFNIGDAADAFYCVMYGSLNVVIDFAHMAAPTLNEFEEILSRARVHSSFLNPGGTQGKCKAYISIARGRMLLLIAVCGKQSWDVDVSQDANYVVRTLKTLECFGDVGLLMDDQHRTASVIATERTLLMKIDKETFLELRSSNIGRELREKVKFLSGVLGFDHWDTESTLRLCGRMERVTFSYNDVVVTEGELASAWQPFLRDGWMVVSDMLMSSCVAVVPLPFATDHVYFVKHGECRFIKRFHLLKKPRSQPSFVEVCSVGSRHYFGSYEIVHGEPNAVFSVLVASPTAILYRVERQDFRQVALKDALTETLLKTEAMQLTARIDETNVKQDLRADTEWEQYKRELTVSILSKHEQEHHVASFGSRSPRADSHIRTVRRPPLPVLPTSSTISSSSSSSSSSPRNGYHRRPSILVTNPTSPQRPVRDKKWLEWAKTRAHEIVTGENGQRLDPPNDQVRSVLSDMLTEADLTVVAVTIKSNIQWSKTSKIMGGLIDESDKVTSVIVSLFARSEDMKR